jgi:8-oxo-dGTP diphosphatase
MNPGTDFVGVTVVYLCHDGTGRYLFNKRSIKCRDEHGRWDCGGGKLELHDTVENTLRKEVKEEYLADIDDVEFIGFRDMHREHEGKPTHWIALDFKVRIDPARAGNGEPHKFDEIGWFKIDEIPEPRHTGLVALLQKYAGTL